MKSSVVTVILFCCLCRGAYADFKPPNPAIPDEIYVASTPCDATLKTILQIPASTNCELAKWTLTLYRDVNAPVPSTFNLKCTYGMAKQGTRGFASGEQSIDVNGRITIEKGAKESSAAIVYRLQARNSAINLSFLRLNENLLHLLDPNKDMLIGTGAWSYTFNRRNPLLNRKESFPDGTSSSPVLVSDSAIVGVYDGRSNCNSSVCSMNGISMNGCQATKYRLTLFQDLKSHSPSTFQLLSVHVGKGDSQYKNEGKWRIIRGSKTNPGVVIYELELDATKPQLNLLLLKGDNDILFFLDQNKNLMVGDADFSFTLNRKRK